MGDIFSKKKRSQVMANIKSKNTTLDLAMLDILNRSKFNFVIYPKMFGNPDFLLDPNVVLFCDSSFWHGKEWDKLRQRLQKGNNSEYWINHIASNRKRDRLVNRTLKSQGYVVLRLWDDKIYKAPEKCIELISRFIT
jgi:DNA mismatch endonuclease (patch repair protein)